MRGLKGRIALLITFLSLALPATAWAGSAQASLTVGVVVPARCALRVAGALPSGSPGVGAGEAVVMKCTKGTLPSGDRAIASRVGAVDPRITRDIVFTSAPAVASTPRPLTDQGPAASTDGVPRLVVTVNF